MKVSYVCFVHAQHLYYTLSKEHEATQILSPILTHEGSPQDYFKEWECWHGGGWRRVCPLPMCQNILVFLELTILNFLYNNPEQMCNVVGCTHLPHSVQLFVLYFLCVSKNRLCLMNFYVSGEL